MELPPYSFNNWVDYHWDVGGWGGWTYKWHLYDMYKILTLVIIIHLLWNLYCPPGSVEFQEIMELRRLHTIWRMYAPPLEVWNNSRKSWNSDDYTPYSACTPPGSVEFQEIVEVCRLHPTRLHPLWKCGIPGNRGSLAVTPHALAPPPRSVEFQEIVEVPLIKQLT